MESQPPGGESAPRYVVGIDLGTTNSAVSYVDTNPQRWRVRTLAVPQVVAPGVIERRETLPSFHYQPASEEFTAGALRLPFDAAEPDHAVGFFARDHGTLVPGRLAVSAKSWLCHGGVDRTAPLLPWHGAADVTRLSPVEVSARYLAHVRAAWDADFPRHPLAEQDLVLTLPASFDEVARELTVKAAAKAGLPRVVLIEEPQAAFYAWIDAHREDWAERVAPGQKILVCDVGGGTSDFTLIRVRADAGGKVRFHRVAVGDHLILGGDNLDLALAHHLESRLKPDGRLEPRPWAVLVRTCRHVKETLLGPNAPQRLTVNLPSTGAKLIGGSERIEVTRDEVRQLLVDGFFPRVGLDDRPGGRGSGFQEFGLPYAPDAAVTRYLAAFLVAHRQVALEDVEPSGGHDPARPDVVLLNGGLFASDVLRRRLLEVLESWFPAPPGEPRWEPIVLENERLDLAVARGAAYYGMVRRGQGERIAAGLARTYFVGIETSPPSAVCLVPAGVEPGREVPLAGRRFDLLVSQPVEFPLYVSSTRLTDAAGELVPIDREQMTPLPPIRTVLKTRKRTDSPVIRVELHARLTEIGTLELWCAGVDAPGNWRLEFDVRSATETDVAAHQGAAEQQGFVEEDVWERISTRLDHTFGEKADEKPAGLIRRLAQQSRIGRNDWPPSLLRRIWERLMELEPGRRRSPQHESRWLNLLGFSLRPGHGLAMDDWRVAQTWKALRGRLVHGAPMCRTEWWILWRRIGGGLAPGQQQALVDPLLASIRGLHRQVTVGKGRGAEWNPGSHEAAEIWRLLGSLELLPADVKIELGGILVDLIPRRKMEPVRPAAVWALGRLGARVPVSGPLNSVVPAETVSAWLDALMDWNDDPATLLAAMQMARRTDDRYRDISDKLRRRLADWLERRAAPRHFLQLVRQGGQLDRQEQGLVFGEALPKGLRIA